MKNQLAFIFEGKRYITMFGAGDYLSTVITDGGNAVPSMNVQTSQGYNRRYKEEFGIEPRNVPIIENASVTMSGSNYIVKGTATLADEQSHNVEITAIGIKVDGEYLSDAPTKPTPITKPVQEPVPEVKPEPVAKEKQPVKDQPTVDKKVEEKPVEEKKPAEEKKPVEEKTPVEEKKPAKPANTQRSFPEGAGFYIGEPSPSNIDNPVLLCGKVVSSHAGFYTGSGVTKIKPVPVTSKFVKQGFTSHPVVKPTEEVVESEAATEDVDRTEAQPQVAAPVKSLKERLREQMNPEINAVIGDIPHPLLGDIAEFTMEPVDRIALGDKGTFYCIDNHWKKAGNWYCIDVVPTASRFFFNARRGVCLEIPTNLCKQWLKAVK